MANERMIQLVNDLREAMARVAPAELRPLPPLPPPATDDELTATEAALRYPLPAEVRDLYSIARGGRIGVLNLTPIDQLAELTKQNLLILEQDFVEPGSDPSHWDGELPQGDLLLISQDWNSIFYECNGPLAGRLVLFWFEGVDDVWGRLAKSLEDCLTWQIVAFDLGAFTIREIPDDIAVLRNAGPVNEKNFEDFEGFLSQIRPHLTAAGGTPAFFDVYDPPPGYTTPVR